MAGGGGTGTLVPTSTITVTEARDQASGTTDLHSPISDASDTTYTHTLHSSADAQVILGLEDVPSDFDSMDASITCDVRHRRFHEAADDTITLNMKITDSTGTVDYTNSIQVDSFTADGSSGGARAWTDSNSSLVLVTVQGQTASKTDWNNARVQFDWIYGKLKGADGIDIDIAEFTLNISYTETVGGGFQSAWAIGSNNIL